MKQRIINNWKAGLHASSVDMTDRWYNSMLGLVMRLYVRGCITEEEAQREIDNMSDLS